MPRVGRRALATAITAVLVILVSGASGDAHGKVVNVAVTCLTPDSGRPLTKVCTAFLKYLDGDAVPRASVHVMAMREGQAKLPPVLVAFKSLDQEGVYSATITFPAYGKWHMRFQVREPGIGEAELLEELLPPAPGATSETRAQLQLLLRFGVADVRNIAVRTIHLLAAASWFALTALVLVLSLVLPPEHRWRLLRRASRAFPWVAGASLLLVAISGIYTARYNAPAPAPGLFAPQVLAKLPFGKAYLAVFSLKMGFMLGIMIVTVALALTLRKAYDRPVPAVAGAARDPNGGRLAPDRLVRGLAVVNLLLGLLTFANVVVLGYLHIITHVGAAAGAR